MNPHRQALRDTRVERVIVALAALSQVLWAYPWFAWLSTATFHWPGPPISFLSAAMLIAATAFLSRSAVSRAWPLLRARISVLVIALLALAIVIGVEMNVGRALWDSDWKGFVSGHAPQLGGAFAFGLYLVWRGIVAGRDLPAFDDHYHKFLFGLAGLVLLIILQGSPIGNGTERGSLAAAGFSAVAYFVTGLLVLALVHLRQMRLDIPNEDGPRPFRRQWLAMAVSVVLGVVALSLALASLFSLDIAAFLGPLGAIADWLVLAIVYGIGYPLGLLATALLYAARFLAHLFGAQRPEPFAPPNITDPDPFGLGSEAYGLPPSAMAAIKWALVAFVVCLALFVMYRALLRQRREQAGSEAEEISESIWSWPAFKKDLYSALAALARRLRRLRERSLRAEQPAPVAVSADRDDDQPLSAREIYRGLLWQGDRMGIARLPSETPDEYQRRIVAQLPAEGPALRLVTESYAAERYGERQADPDQLAILNKLWRRLRDSMVKRPS